MTIFDTLSAKIHRFEIEWIKNNPTKAEYSYGWISSVVIGLSQDPLKSLKWFCSIAVIGALLVSIQYAGCLLMYEFFGECSWLSSWIDWAIPNVCKTIPDLSSLTVAKSEEVGRFYSLWAVQASMATLLYPIVITYVSILLQKQNNAKSILSIYFYDSGAILSGMSSIALIGFMAIQLFFLKWMSESIYLYWLAIDFLWFTFNCLLTTYFLYRTFEFIGAEGREGIVKKYLINVIWPKEVRVHLANFYYRDAVAQKFLPCVDKFAKKHGYIPVVFGYAAQGDNFCKIEKRLAGGEFYLNDVKFNLLNWALSGWLERASKQLKNAHKAGNGLSNPQINFPAELFEKYKNGCLVCKVLGSTSLRFYERALIRWAFKFDSASKAKLKLTVELVLRDQFGDLGTCISEGDSVSFEEKVIELSEVFESLIDVSETLSQDGSKDNLWQLGDSFKFWVQPMIFQTWSHSLLGLFLKAIEKIETTPRFATNALRIPRRIFVRSIDKGLPLVAGHFLYLNSLFLKQIEVWWSHSIERGSALNENFKHDVCNHQSLTLPLYSIHEDLIVEFLGMWETYKESIDYRKDKLGSMDYAGATFLGGLYKGHIEQTLYMLLECAYKGDINGASWFGDYLSKWLDVLGYESDIDFYRALQTYGFFSVVGLSADAKLQLESIVPTQGAKYLSGSQALQIAVKNLWSDIILLGIYILLVWSKDCSCEKSTANKIIRALIDGTSLRNSGNALNIKKPFDSFDDFLISIIRQRLSDASYTSELNRIASNALEVPKQTMMKNRIYSNWGADGLESVDDGMLMLLILVVPVRWSPNANLSLLIKKLIKDKKDSYLISMAIDGWINRLKGASLDGYVGLFKCVHLSGEDFEKNRAQVIEYLHKISELVTSESLDVLAAASISDERVRAIEEYVSSKAFELETSGFPINIFQKLILTPQKFTDYVFKLNGLSKGNLTEPQLSPEISNEKDWFSGFMQSHIASCILGLSLHELKPRNIVCATPEAYWAEILSYVDYAKRHQLTPLLIIENRASPEWLFNWIHPYFDDRLGGKPADLVVTKNHINEPANYVCHLNGIPVYWAELGQSSSLLVCKESFTELSVTKLDHGGYFETSVESDDVNPASINLIFKISMNVALNPGLRSVFLNYSPPSQGEGH